MQAPEDSSWYAESMKTAGTVPRTVLVHASSLEVVYKLATMLFAILKPHPLFLESSAVKICHSGQRLQHQQNSIYQALLSLSLPPS